MAYFDPLLNELFTRMPNTNVVYYKSGQVEYTMEKSGKFMFDVFEKVYLLELQQSWHSAL